MKHMIGLLLVVAACHSSDSATPRHHKHDAGAIAGTPGSAAGSAAGSAVVPAVSIDAGPEVPHVQAFVPDAADRSGSGSTTTTDDLGQLRTSTAAIDTELATALAAGAATPDDLCNAVEPTIAKIKAAFGPASEPLPAAIDAELRPEAAALMALVAPFDDQSCDVARFANLTTIEKQVTDMRAHTKKLVAIAAKAH